MLDPTDLAAVRAALYFDHNATTPLAGEVRRAMAEAMLERFGNASSLHTEGRASRGVLDATRRAVARLLGCPPERVFFTSGGTEGNNTVIKGVFTAARAAGAAGGTTTGAGGSAVLCRGGGPGHIVTSLIEHESVLGACRQIEALGGRVTYLPAGPDGRVRPADVAAALRPDTLLVTIMHANNETGAVQPVAEIARIAAAAGVPFHTDAVQTFGKLPTRVDDLGCEFLTLTAHKIRGPKGVGAIYWRGTTPYTPLIYGGDQELGRRAGTEGVHQLAGLGAACTLAERSLNSEFPRLRKLRRLLLGGLRRLHPSLLVHEAAAEWQLSGTINAAFPGKSGLRLLAGLDCYRIGVSIGSACTADRVEPSHVLLGMGLSAEQALSSIRISLGATNGLLAVGYFLWVMGHVLTEDPPGFAYLDPQHLTLELLRDPDTFTIDVRLPHERLSGPSIPGAREWSTIGFERRIPEIPRDRLVVLMCGTGILSTGAGYRLARSGHPRVRVIFGGYAAWRALHPDAIRLLGQTGR